MAELGRSAELARERVSLPVGDPRCDGQNRAYYRLDSEKTGIVHRFSALDGSDRAFSIDPALGSMTDFAVSPAGEIYALTEAKAGGRIAVFDTAGNPTPSVELPPWVFGDRLALFSSGGFLVLGQRFLKPGLAEPLIAVFDRDGTFVNNVHWDGPGGGRLRYGEMGTSEAYRLGVSGLDYAGDRVVMILSGSGKLLVIAPTGAVVRSIALPPPADGMAAINVRVSGNQAVVHFQRSSDATAVYEMYDLTSGDLLASFSEPGVSASPSCYDGKALGFFGVDLHSTYMLRYAVQ